MRLCPHCLTDIDTDGTLPDGLVTELVGVVCERLVVEPSKVFSPNRTPRVVDARNASIALLRDLFGLSYPQLGRIFNRDHTTVMHSYNRADRHLVRALADDIQTLAPDQAHT